MEATQVKNVGNSVRELLAMGETHKAIDLLIAAGHGYHSTVGAFTTGIAGGGAGTIIDQNQPEFIASIGGNMAMIPFRIAVQTELPLLAADDDEAEILLAVDRLAAFDRSGTYTTEDTFNMRTDLGNSKSGPLTVVSAVTGDVTNPTLGIELDRAIAVGDVQTAVGVLWGKLALLYEPKHPKIIVGNETGAAVYGYWGGTVAVNGYAQLQAVVFDAAWAKDVRSA